MNPKNNYGQSDILCKKLMIIKITYMYLQHITVTGQLLNKFLNINAEVVVACLTNWILSSDTNIIMQLIDITAALAQVYSINLAIAATLVSMRQLIDVCEALLQLSPVQEHDHISDLTPSRLSFCRSVCLQDESSYDCPQVLLTANT